jgi:hypothetical protein
MPRRIDGRDSRQDLLAGFPICQSCACAQNRSRFLTLTSRIPSPFIQQANSAAPNTYRAYRP